MPRANARARDEELEALLREDRLERARNNIFTFTKHTNDKYMASWHHKAICRELNAFVDGQFRFLILMAPPRTGKSELVSRRLPAYILGRSPDEQVIAASYSDDLASRMNRDVQRIIESPEYQELFPDTYLAHKGMVRPGGGSWLRNAGEFECVGRTGIYRCAGIGSGITGRGGHTAIIDDPIKDAAQARSKAYRDRAWDWYTSTLRSRLEGTTSRVLLTLTRWHEDDLAGRLLELAKADPEADQWRVVTFPMLKEGSADQRDPRNDGEALWPDKYPESECRRIRASVQERVWGSLYQQHPAPDEGATVKRTWLKYYTVAPSKFDVIIQSWDCAFKDGEKNDFVCGQVWGRIGADKYLLAQDHRKMDLPETIAAVLAMSKRFPAAVTKLIEDKANGPAVIQSLKKKVVGLTEFKSTDSKEARLAAVSPQFESGNVYLPDESIAPWIGKYVEELVSFPFAKNDDQVDATTQALLRLEGTSYSVKAAGKL